MHRFLKQFIYGFLYLAVLALIGGGLYIALVTPAPTCADGIKNQDETEIDCGGVCDSCELKHANLLVRDSYIFSAGDNTATVAVRIENPMQNYSASSFDYTATLMSAFGVPLGTVSGNASLAAKTDKFIVMTNINHDARDIDHVVFMPERIVWKLYAADKEFALAAGEKFATSISGNTIKADGTLINNGSIFAPKLLIFATVFNEKNVPIAASKTKIDGVPAFGSAPFTVFFPLGNGVNSMSGKTIRIDYEIDRL